MADGLKIPFPDINYYLLGQKKGLTASTKGISKDLKAKEKMAEEFESFLIFTMMKELGKIASITKKGYMEETYNTLIYEKLGDYIAKKGIGIKEMILRYMDNMDNKREMVKVLNESDDKFSKIKGTIEDEDSK